MVEVLIGIISGTISGTGMGGGTILIFLLTVLCGIEQHIAQATNLIFFIPTSIVAIIVNIKNKNIDLKLRDVFDKVGIFSLSAAGVGLAAINNGKDKITDLTSTQIAKLTEYRIRKQEEKQERDRQSAIKEAEALEEANIRSRTMDHKKGMIEALTAQERTEYDLKHEENLTQKEQLRQALLAQRNRLLNIQNEELEAKPKSR